MPCGPRVTLAPLRSGFTCCTAVPVLLQYGADPAQLDGGDDTGQRLNFSWPRYAALLPMLRGCKTDSELKGQLKALRDQGGLAEVATGGGGAACRSGGAARSGGAG